MEELNLLLGWLFRASNWLPDFVPQIEEDRFGGHCGVAECRAVRPYSLWSVDYLELRKMVKVACSQATALDAHVVIVVGPECLCSILKYYFGELRRSLICGIRPTSSLFYGRLHAKEPNHNGSKTSFSFQLVKFYLFLTWEIVVDPD